MNKIDLMIHTHTHTSFLRFPRKQKQFAKDELTDGIDSLKTHNWEGTLQPSYRVSQLTNCSQLRESLTGAIASDDLWAGSWEIPAHTRTLEILWSVHNTLKYGNVSEQGGCLVLRPTQTHTPQETIKWINTQYMLSFQYVWIHSYYFYFRRGCTKAPGHAHILKHHVYVFRTGLNV